jgi:hypothetical protein
MLQETVHDAIVGRRSYNDAALDVHRLVIDHVIPGAAGVFHRIWRQFIFAAPGFANRSALRYSSDLSASLWNSRVRSEAQVW